MAGSIASISSPETIISEKLMGYSRTQQLGNYYMLEMLKHH